MMGDWIRVVKKEAVCVLERFDPIVFARILIKLSR